MYVYIGIMRIVLAYFMIYFGDLSLHCFCCFIFWLKKTKPIFFMSLERRTKRVSVATGFCKKKKVHITCIDLVNDIFLKRQEIKNLCKVFLWTCQNHGRLPPIFKKLSWNYFTCYYILNDYNIHKYLNRFYGIFLHTDMNELEYVFCHCVENWKIYSHMKNISSNQWFYV